MNLLFSINDGYVEQFKVTLYSIFQNSRYDQLAVYVLQQPQLQRHDEVEAFCQALGATYYPIIIDEQAFADAPTTDRYPETIYYRLLAHDYLPTDLDKILYLDADILCINDLSELYNINLGDKLYAAASHTENSRLTDTVNRLRLGDYSSEFYFNSGVLLMNLSRIRQVVQRQDIMAYIEKKGDLLFLPDQDVLTALYGHHVLRVPDVTYNFDTRYQLIYSAKSGGEQDLDWVMAHTVILHFCGRDKPLKSSYRGVFSGLYKHYQQLAKKVAL